MATKRDVRGYAQIHIDKADDYMRQAAKDPGPEAIVLYEKARGNYSAAGERAGVELATKKILDITQKAYMSQADRQMQMANRLGEDRRAIQYLKEAARLYSKAGRTGLQKKAAEQIREATEQAAKRTRKKLESVS